MLNSHGGCSPLDLIISSFYYFSKGGIIRNFGLRLFFHHASIKFHHASPYALPNIVPLSPIYVSGPKEGYKKQLVCFKQISKIKIGGML